MTAVEFLLSKIASKIDDKYYSNQQDITEYVEQANKMFEQQIIDALEYGWDNGHIHISILEDVEEKYYTSTYGSKGSETKQ